ncbi:MAG TPA: hypothetical protein VFR17_01555 [Mycobacterium sp.]|nr:hypothetical protein [Mycobacterium sp.]
MTDNPRSAARENPPSTGIIRRAPTGPIPSAAGQTGSLDRTPSDPGSAILPESPAIPDRPGFGASAATAVSAAAVAILSGWATGVVATDLIAGWWQSDRLFCVAVAFLSLVFGVTTVSGVILLLRRRPLGRYLIAVGAVVALLTFSSLFIAGARVPWVVHAIPVLQIASAVLALHPATKRWLLPTA